MHATATYSPPCDIGLDIVYADEFLLLVNKPAGLLAVPGRGADKADSLISRVQQEFPEALTVHRLDMDTSGLVMLARGAGMQRSLSGLFRERRIEKSYQAVVLGNLEHPDGEIDRPLSSDWPNRPKQKINYDEGKPSLTRYRLLSYDESSNQSLVALEPVTGRTHQLRVHMASIGHPIAGDALYGNGIGSTRLLLHARMLGFEHPHSGQKLTVLSEAPF